MSDKSGGFFSSVGRFFSGGGSATKSKDAEKSFETADDSKPSSSDATASPTSTDTASFLRDIISIDSGSPVESDDIIDRTPQISASSRISRSLRYLSPSALERREQRSVNGLQIDVDPVPDIFFTTPSVSTTRKRQLTELDKQTLPQSFRSESVKRSRFLNRSLLEPTVKSSIGASDKRLDMTWCGELTSNHSPASSITNFSLLSRRSGATTNGSLSTRTQEIYKKLEGATTPAKEVQRMTTLRAGLSRPEKWAPSEDSVASVNPPPLKKAGDGIPSRIQLISKSMATSVKRAPYWRDLTRKRGESVNGDAISSETNSLKSLNGNFASTELSSLFSLDPPVSKKSAPSTIATLSSTTAAKKQHVSILKGPDGKPVSRNTFRLDDEDSEDSQPLPPLPASLLSNPIPLKLAPGASAPKKGFLDNLSFQFCAPAPIEKVSKSNKTASIVSSRDSDSCEETHEKASSDSEDSEDSDGSEESEAQEVKDSRPQTSADTISTANGSNQSSTDSSPKVAETKAPAAAPVTVKPAAAAQWECQSCFTNWPATNDKCGCCGTPKAGASSEPVKASEKQLVSNLASFAPTKSSGGGGFAFGFGGFGGGASTAPAPATAAPAAPKPFGASSAAPSTSMFGSSAPKPSAPAPVAAPAPTPAAPAATSSDRVAWECPDCFVSNKATDDKCPCCSHVKYQSAGGSASSNVFGARAFNPTAAAPTMSFGFGGGAAAPASSATAPAFGFSSSAAAPATSVAPAAPAAPAPPAPVKLPDILPKTTPSLFGSIAKPAEPAPAPVVAAPATSSIPAFGSGSSSLFGAQKPATTVDAAPKPSLFGAPATTAAPAPLTTLPGIAPSSSLFGASSTSSTPFGGSSLFGGQSAPKLASEAPKPSTTLLFGAPSSTNDAPKTGLFDSAAPAPSTSIFGAGSSSSGLFGKPADSTTSSTSAVPSMFGAKKPISFGGDVGTTTTDGGAPKRGLFSSDSGATAPKLSFGGPSSGFGTTPAPTSTGSSLFGGSGTSSMFGGNAPSSSAIPAFGSATSSAPKPFGSAGTISFGGPAAAVPAFGGFGKSTQPAMSTSSSTNSLFGQSAPAPDSSNPFASTVSSSNNNGFNFSSSSSTTSTSSNNGGVFQFGGAPAPAPAPGGGAFQFGGPLPPPAPSGSLDSNAFAYQAPTGGGGARKMAMARRRNVRK